MRSHKVPHRHMRTLVPEAHSRESAESTLHEPELLQCQMLPLGRGLTDSSTPNFPASFCGDSDSQAATVNCNDLGRQAGRPFMLTGQQLSSESQPHHRKRHTVLPAAPCRKLPQHSFPHQAVATCGTAPAVPVLDGMSGSSMGLCQGPLKCCMQSEAMQADKISSLPQDAACAASMSVLLAVAQPVSSATELLQRLHSGSIAAPTSSGHDQHSGNNVIPAVTNCKPSYTGAGARHARAAGKGCLPFSPALVVQSETGSFHKDHEARQPSTCAHAIQLVENWLACSHRQTAGYAETAHHSTGAAKRKAPSGAC